LTQPELLILYVSIGLIVGIGMSIHDWWEGIDIETGHLWATFFIGILWLPGLFALALAAIIEGKFVLIKGRRKK